MQFTLEIHRCTREDKRRYVQTFLYSSDNSSETIATALTNLNSTRLADMPDSGRLSGSFYACGITDFVHLRKQDTEKRNRTSAARGRIRRKT